MSLLEIKNVKKNCQLSFFILPFCHKCVKFLGKRRERRETEEKGKCRTI